MAGDPSVDRTLVRSAGALTAALLVAYGLAWWSIALPEARPASAPLEAFSAGRAMPIIRHLASDIGLRAIGTPGYERAAEDLAAELRRIPGVEVELQRISGVQVYPRARIPYPPFAYRVTNVIARIPGRSREALLLDSHYDTWTDGLGGGDAALGVAAVIETARALASGPPLERSVIVLANGGEEGGMFAAAAFLKHPLARDVRAYLYVDGSPGGRATLLDVGPGNRWLARAFAEAAPRPNGWVLGQDLVDSGLLPHDGDFHPLGDGGLIGLSFGSVADMWAPHTTRDTAERVDPRALQHTGDLLLAGARRILAAPMPGNVDARRFVYYDLLGRTLVVYGHGAARALAVLAVCLVIVALVVARRRDAIRAGGVARSVGLLLLATLGALLGAILAGTLVGLVLRRPHGWYSAPSLAALSFGASAALGPLWLLLWRRRRADDRTTMTTWAGALVLLALLVGLAAIFEIGSGYLALWSVVPGTLGFLGALRWPRARALLWLVGYLPAATLVLELAVVLVPFFAADLGLVAAPVPLDPLMAALVALAVIALLPLAIVPLAGSKGLRGVTLAVTALAVAGIAASALHPPYSTSRPKRLVAAVQAREGRSALLLASVDALPWDPLRLGTNDAAPADKGWSDIDVMTPPATHTLPAAPPPFPPPRLELLDAQYDAARDIRTVRAHLVAHGTQLRLLLPLGRLAGWSLGPVPTTTAVPGRALVLFEGADPDDKRFTIELKGRDPVEFELRDLRSPSAAPEVEALRRRLPPWTSLHTLDEHVALQTL